MYRGTTPVITLKINGNIDLYFMKEIWITLEDHKKELTLKKSEGRVVVNPEEKKLEFQLTQHETLDFNNDVNVQIRFLKDNGDAFASDIKKISLKDILKEGVIE